MTDTSDNENKKPEPSPTEESVVTLSKNDLTQDFWIHIAETANDYISGTRADYVSHILFRVSDVVSMQTELAPVYSGSHIKKPQLIVKLKDSLGYRLCEKTGNKVIAVFQACRLCLKVESDVRANF